MTIIQLLCEYPRIKYDLVETNDRIKMVQAMREDTYGDLSCPISRFGQAPMPFGRVGDPTAQRAMTCDYYDDRLDLLKAKRRVLEGYINQAHEALKKLSDKERELVKLRYFQQRQWYDICALMNIGRTTAHNTRNKVFQKLST